MHGLLTPSISTSQYTAGVYCSLLTGQEKRLVPFAEHTSATVEMANLANVRAYVARCPPVRCDHASAH